MIYVIACGDRPVCGAAKLAPRYGSLEPYWIDSRRLHHWRVPGGLYSWLQDKGSLTARIKSACPAGAFRVRVRRQAWDKPLYSESRLLGVRRGTIAIIREVELHCAGVPWVFARTLIPSSSLDGPARRLGRLGERPLGEVLFSDPRMRRGTMEVARLLPRHPLLWVAVNSLEQAPDMI